MQPPLARRATSGSLLTAGVPRASSGQAAVPSRISNAGSAALSAPVTVTPLAVSAVTGWLTVNVSPISITPSLSPAG